MRRVAVYVAGNPPPEDIFATVCAEAGRVLAADAAALMRMEPDGTATGMGGWTRGQGSMRQYVGLTHAIGPGTVIDMIQRTGRPARLETYQDTDGPLAEYARLLGWRSSVGAPVTAGDRLWGVMVIARLTDRWFAKNTGARLAEFTELLGAAVTAAESRAELTASRARIVATADQTRRRIERDLHDGAQQRLVSLALRLRLAQQSVPPEQRAQLSGIVDGLTAVVDELRTLAHGIHPAALSEGGLPTALRSLARRSAVPVQLEVRVVDRLPEQVEVAGYFVASEALANTTKYARASLVRLDAELRDDALHLTVADDGCGGADLRRGSGLMGLRDRVEAIGGRLTIDSPPGRGTTISARLPVSGH